MIKLFSNVFHSVCPKGLAPAIQYIATSFFREKRKSIFAKAAFVFVCTWTPPPGRDGVPLHPPGDPERVRPLPAGAGHRQLYQLPEEEASHR
jgi:hypothetical protein